jgi:hypothetical protein
MMHHADARATMLACRSARLVSLVACACLWATLALAEIPPGDVNCDDKVDARDVTAVVDAIFIGSSCQAGVADVNGDQRISGADLPAEVMLVAAPPLPTPTRTATSLPPSPTPTATPTTPPSLTPTLSPSSTPTVTATSVPSATASETSTPTLSGTPTQTPTVTGTFTATSTPTSSAPGPVPVYFGIASGDGCIGCEEPLCQCFGPTPTPMIEGGRQVFVQRSGQFRIVVEAKRGTNGQAVGTTLLPANPADRPALQIENTMPMGADPTLDVDCRHSPPWLGIPGVNPPDFGAGQTITDILTDFSCRFIRFTTGAPCTYIDATGDARVVSPDAEVQFCDYVSSGAIFQPGDSLLTVQLADVQGNLGPVAQIVVRVATPTPTP